MFDIHGIQLSLPDDGGGEMRAATRMVEEAGTRIWYVQIEGVLLLFRSLGQ